MLGTEILKQGRLFLEAVAFGAFLMLCYDGLRILRRIRSRGMAAVAAEDLLFWLLCAFGMFGFMYRLNDGVFRGFLILGVAVGMAAYSAFVSRHVVCAGTVCLRRIQHHLRHIFFAVGVPFRRFRRFLRKKQGRNRIFCKKLLQKWKKQLKKLCKAVRIRLRKL